MSVLKLKASTQPVPELTADPISLSTLSECSKLQMITEAVNQRMHILRGLHVGTLQLHQNAFSG